MISAREANEISNGLEAILYEIELMIKSEARNRKFSISYYTETLDEEREIALIKILEKKGYNISVLKNNIVISWKEI